MRRLILFGSRQKNSDPIELHEMVARTLESVLLLDPNHGSSLQIGPHVCVESE